jgi:hypothetical protein
MSEMDWTAQAKNIGEVGDWPLLAHRLLLA